MKGPITGLDIGHISKPRLKKLLKKRRKLLKKERKVWRKEIRKRKRKLEKTLFLRTHRTLKGTKVRWKKCPQKGCHNRVPVASKSSEVISCGLCSMRLALGRNKDRFTGHRTPTQRRKLKEFWEEQHPKFKKFKKDLKKIQKEKVKKRKRAIKLAAERSLRKQRDQFMLIVESRSRALKREPRNG